MSSISIPSEVARRYTKGLFKAAYQQKILPLVLEDLQHLNEAFFASAQKLHTPLSHHPFWTPLIPRSLLIKMMKNISQESGFQSLTCRFIEVLVQTRRLPLLALIVSELQKQMEEANKVLSGSVTSAYPLDSEQEKKLTRILSSQLGRRVRLTKNVDPQLLGGIVVQVGSYLIDSSLKNKMQRLAIKLATLEN